MGGDDPGILENIQQGALNGAAAGFVVGSSRAFLYSSEFSAHAEKVIADAKAANPNISRAALRALTPTPLPALLTTTAAWAGITSVYFTTSGFLKTFRDKDDHWNNAIGAATAGSLAGLRRASVRLGAGCAAAMFFSSLFVDVSGGVGPVDDSIVAKRKALYE